MAAGITLWNRCVRDLQAELPEQDFNTWIRPLQAVEDGDVLRLLAPNRFVVDWLQQHYLQRILEFEAYLGEMEESLLNKPSDSVMTELVGYRSELRKLRRIFSYHNRLVEEILAEEPACLGAGQEESGHLWRALLDRCERLFSLTGMYYEICGDLVEGYISISSHELNTTMKILTIITAIFVPLSFLAGLYGMNFDNIPELHHPSGYHILLGLMALIATGMLLLFRRIRWL